MGLNLRFWKVKKAPTQRVTCGTTYPFFFLSSSSFSLFPPISPFSLLLLTALADHFRRSFLGLLVLVGPIQMAVKPQQLAWWRPRWGGGVVAGRASLAANSQHRNAILWPIFTVVLGPNPFISARSSKLCPNLLTKMTRSLVRIFVQIKTL